MSTMEKSKGRKCVIIFVPLLLILLGTSLAFGALNQGPWKIPEKVFRIQMPFIANEGQIGDEHVRFYATTFAGTVYVTDKGEMVYLLSSSEPRTGKKLSTNGTTKTWIIKEKLVDSFKTLPEGRDKAQTKVNHFIGNDKSKWKTDIANYNLVSLGEIYPGVELQLKAYGKRVEKIFTVKPGADPHAINLKIEGAKSLKVNEKGELEIKTGPGEVRYSKPLAYQEKNGKRENIQVAYNLDKSRYGFRVGDYDTTLPLIIDPEVVYSRFLGGSAVDAAFDIAVDTQGNAYVAGETSSSDFPTYPTLPPLPYDRSFNGSTDAFVAKLDPNGSLVYATYLGGTLNDRAYGIAVDASGNAYVTGQTYSKYFPTTANAFSTKFSGKADAFVVKLNDTGSTLLYSTFFGGGSVDKGNAIAVHVDGSAYITGETLPSNFPVTPYAAFASSRGKVEAFAVRIDPAKSGVSSLIYSTFLGGTGDDTGYAIAVDELGYAYITGQTSSVNFPIKGDNAAAYDNALYGPTDAFVTKLLPVNDIRGAVLTYSTYLGGSGNDAGFGIALDASKNAYVTGQTSSADFPKTTTTSLNGPTDAFVAKLNADGSTLPLSTLFGGGGSDSGEDIALGVAGNIYILGNTAPGTGTVLCPQSQSGNNIGPLGGNDIFLAEFNNAGLTLVRYFCLGGTSSDFGWGLALDQEAAYMTGQTSSSNFPKEPDTNPPLQGTDAFVIKLSTLKCFYPYAGPYQNDSDGDGIPDFCDNCPQKANGPLLGTCVISKAPCVISDNVDPCKQANSADLCSMNQEDSDNDDRGDVCDNEFTLTAVLSGTLANICFDYIGSTGPSYNIVKPDCFNTVFTCTYLDSGGNTVIITPIDRIRQAYWIPPEGQIKDVNDPTGESDVAKLDPGTEYCFSCNLFDQYNLEDLGSKGTVRCTATYANYIQDPNGVVPLVTGAVSSNEIQIAAFQYVLIDLKPTLNLQNEGVTPVQIFGNANFNPRKLNLSILTLTGNYSNKPIPFDPSCVYKYWYKDLNPDIDNYTDMEIHYYTTGCLRNYLDVKDTVIYLNGTNGTTIWGSDTVSVIK